jgi:hypothetical protein
MIVTATIFAYEKLLSVFAIVNLQLYSSNTV